MVESKTYQPLAASGEIIKSQSDKRTYKYITLKNKLQCILIQDDEADKSSASLDVSGVGAASDPKEYYGTAHFLEHMLFMGSKKYPDQNDYAEFIKSHGGASNAYTGMTYTNYHFDVSNEAFEGALDRFA
jgi:insulysin